MPQMNADAAVLAKEASNFERIADELKAVIGAVDMTANTLKAQWTGQAGMAAQTALQRFDAAAATQIRELNDISTNVHTSGSNYTSTDDDQAGNLAHLMQF
jgi:WXG100 family type VII secretion target